MYYDIIHQELHSKYFYSAFLESLEYMSFLFREEVVRWSYQEFNDIILHNDIVPPLLFNSWLQYLDLIRDDNSADDKDLHYYRLIADMHDLNVSPYWTTT